MKYLKSNIAIYTKTFFLFAFVFWTASLAHSWTETDSAPTLGNTLPPVLELSSLDQIKEGGLLVGALTVYSGNSATFINSITIESGNPGDGKVFVSSDDQGNGKWATLSLTAPEDAVSCRRQTGTSGTLGGLPYKYSASSMTDANGIWQYPDVYIRPGYTVKSSTVTISPDQVSCAYWYEHSAHGENGNYTTLYCDGVDERISYKDIGAGKHHPCNAMPQNGTRTFDNDNNEGQAGCFTVCKEVQFTYVPKSASECTNLGKDSATGGTYKGTLKVVNDATLSSSPINACKTTYTAPAPKSKPVTQCAPGWTPYRDACI